jgi:hypothetical protein
MPQGALRQSPRIEVAPRCFCAGIFLVLHIHRHGEGLQYLVLENSCYLSFIKLALVSAAMLCRELRCALHVRPGICLRPAALHLGGDLT